MYTYSASTIIHSLFVFCFFVCLHFHQNNGLGCCCTMTPAGTQGLHYYVVMRCLVTCGLTSAMINSLHNTVPTSRNGDRSCEDGVWLRMWRGNNQQNNNNNTTVTHAILGPSGVRVCVCVCVCVCVPVSYWFKIVSLHGVKAKEVHNRSKRLF